MKRLFLSILIAAAFVSEAYAADPAVIAAGGGYRKMVDALAAEYTAETGVPVQLVYGNMGQVTAQAGKSGAVDIVIGAEFFLRRAGLVFKRQTELGRGRLVLAWSRQCPVKGDPVEFLQSGEVSRIALPDSKRAIYGRAASQYLRRTGLSGKLGAKLVEVATVPQVFSYLNLNEVDMGFMNLTHALNVRDSLGGYCLIPEDGHEPIRILAGCLADAAEPAAADAFFAFLNTEISRKIVSENGL